MTIRATHWDRHPINDGVIYSSKMSEEQNPYARSSGQVMLQPPGSWPHHLGVNPSAKTIVLNIRVVDEGTAPTRQRELQKWFRQGYEAWLTIMDDGTERDIKAVVIGSVPYAGGPLGFGVTLSAADPRWQSTTHLSAGQLFTSSGQEMIVTNPGNIPIDDPLITIRPIYAKPQTNGNRYGMHAIVVNRADYALDNYTIDITDGGWDHASAVAAGLSQADGDDIRVLVDGLPVMHWFGEHATTAPNQATTKIFINGDWPAKLTATLRTAIGTVYLPRSQVEVFKGGTAGWPSFGTFAIDGEVFTYEGKTLNNINGEEAFTGVRRAQRHTSAATHSAGGILYQVSHKIEVLFGSTGETALPARGDIKPLLDLSSSSLTNSLLQWSVFRDEDNPNRAMPWLRRLASGYANYDKVLEATDSPLPSMVAEYLDGGPVAGKPNYNEWYRPFPTGLLASTSSAFRAVASQAFTAANNVTVTKPTGTSDDDLMIGVVSVATTNPGTFTPPSGWTEIASQMGAAPFFKVYVKWASSEGASYQWSWDGGPRTGFAAIYTSDKASSVTLLSQGTSATTDVYPTTVTPSLNPSWLVGIGSKNTNGAFTPPTGWTERFEAGSNVGLEIVDRLYSANANDRLVIADDSGPSSAGAYAMLQIGIRGPIKYTKAVADTMALAHWVLDGDGNRYMSGWDLPESTPAVTQTFSFTGAEQTFIVPSGVTSLLVDAKGPAAGGAGGRVVANLTVTPGETLRIYVGGPASGGTGGYNGGGSASNGGYGGAGATDLRQGGSGAANRVIVAGGGGGNGASGNNPGGVGGQGGPETGGTGGNGSSVVGGTITGGGGGTPSAGGAAGSPSGNAGALSNGGAGATGGVLAPGGGGGGGGYYGGGGGGQGDWTNTDDQDYFGSGGGGGGGSSYAGAGTSNVQHLTNSGSALLTLLYTTTGTQPPKAWVPYAPQVMYEHSFISLSPVVFRPPLGTTPTGENLTATMTANAQQFQVPSGSGPFYLQGVRVLMNSTASSSQLQVGLYADLSDAVGQDLALSSTITFATVGTPFWQYVPFTNAIPLEPGQKYWIGFKDATASGAAATWSYQSNPRKFKRATAIEAAKAWQIAIICTPQNTADFDGYAKSDDGAQNSMSGVHAYLDPTQTPQVILTAYRPGYYRFERCTIYNETTDQSISFDVACQLGQSLMFNMRTGQYVNADEEGGAEISDVVFSDPAGKFSLAPGANYIQVIDEGMTGVSVLFEGPPRWE